MNSDLKTKIEDLWVNKETENFTNKVTKEFIFEVLNLLDTGQERVAEKIDGNWKINEWLKKAILLSFKVRDSSMFSSGISNSRGGQYSWYDKVDLKTSGWVEDEWTKRGFRSVPGAIVRYSAHIAESVVLMPSFVNLGAYVDSGTMIDTWATVGSCAQIGKNVHLSGGAGIGGVLEPIQANPVIIEDNCFIGARSEVAEGVIVREGSVLSMGVYIGASTKIVNRETGEVIFGEVPPYSVVVPGSLPGKKTQKGEDGPSLYCAVIVKQVDEKTRSKTSINDLLRS
ncbi:MAG: 2,3,4,5-tetrahydropyridine-2,6-dicarboxylate N-succinyltransferase [Alphaproteobacteria bacterium]|jgi:2,3,4,5-tetrahydropyridine-2-carboxylate N-succinyltransferase|nr:2,3,4,5-tetrahydropyridine-2,6-dicarboxylate N-succinyltransferase [Alphaproteobacteria bacterium]